MSIDPAAQAVLDAMKEFRTAGDTANDTAWAVDWRDCYRQANRFTPDAPALHDVEDRAGPVPVRVYTPVPEPRGTIAFFHGGGLIGGDLDSHDGAVRHLALSSGRRVVAAEYRLAPEHPFPAAHEDCFAAYRIALQFGSPVATVGDSVGGLLAVSVALMARDRGVTLPDRMVAMYPNADLREERDHPSMDRYDGNVVDLEELHRGLSTYLLQANRSDPIVSPGLAELHGLPPALVLTCELDPLRDEGEHLATRLAAEHRRELGMIHGWFQFSGAIPRGRELIAEVGAWLRVAEAG